MFLDEVSTNIDHCITFPKENSLGEGNDGPGTLFYLSNYMKEECKIKFPCLYKEVYLFCQLLCQPWCYFVSKWRMREDDVR